MHSQLSGTRPARGCMHVFVVLAATILTWRALPCEPRPPSYLAAQMLRVCRFIRGGTCIHCVCSDSLGGCVAPASAHLAAALTVRCGWMASRVRYAIPRHFRPQAAGRRHRRRYVTHDKNQAAMACGGHWRGMRVLRPPGARLLGSSSSLPASL